MAQRKGGIGPLDPLFDVDTVYGAIAAGNSPASCLITVTVEEQSGQTDPVLGTNVFYDVVFSEDVTGFTAADVTLSGTALPTTVVVTGAGDTYQLEVSGMTVSGTVVATIGPSKVATVDGCTNRHSTSIDNVINWALTSNTCFSYTGTVQTWEVPAGVFLAEFECVGAAGSTQSGSYLGAPGGSVTATFAVTPGQVFDIRVGGASQIFGGGNGSTGSGSENAGPGGDYSAVTPTGSPLVDSLVVGGGGGGNGGTTAIGGYPDGGDGPNAAIYDGDGGTQIAGGAAGVSEGGGVITQATDGASFQGGDGGGSTSAFNDSGGGGGGGWFGGGGAGTHSNGHFGGGGGSSYYSGAAMSVVVDNGSNSGEGFVCVVWAAP